jgi:hypothetical protein
MMYPTFAEPLERRQLLAGVTVFLPAFNGGLTNWIDTAVNGIDADLGGAQNVPEYVLNIAPNTSDGTLAIQSVTHVAGSGTPQTSPDGQIILIADTTSIGTNPAYTPPEAAALVTNFMENASADGVTLAQLPIHLISTSIGTAFTDAIAQNLDQSGIWVDQETYIDPDPDTSAPFNDPLNAIYDNVEFADDYWRQNPDGSNTNTNPSGHPINGAYNLELSSVQADFSTFGLAHLAPPAWYDGTIDPALIGTNEGQGTIQADWYGPSDPQPQTTGFAYTLIGGLARPADGLWAASGGTGARTTVAHSGQQWPNISDLTPASTTLNSEQTSLGLNYIQQDQGANDTITYSLDSNQNPFDGTGAQIGTQTGLAASTSTNNGSFNASVANVPSGTYYVCAAITNSAGLVRYAYSQQQVTITTPISLGFAANASPSTVTGVGTHLLVNATDTAGSALTYTWAFTHLPAGAKQPTIKRNGTPNALVTFYKQGGYQFSCTITDTLGNQIVSSGGVDVVLTPAKVVYSPTHPKVAKNDAIRLIGAVVNQFGRKITGVAPTFSLVSGVGTVTSDGIFEAGGTPGIALIKIEDDGLSAMLDVDVVK